MSVNSSSENSQIDAHDTHNAQDAMILWTLGSITQFSSGDIVREFTKLTKNWLWGWRTDVGTETQKKNKTGSIKFYKNTNPNQ